MHHYVSQLTSTPKAELYCSCKRRKFIGQNKVKICKLQSQNLNFFVKKLVALMISVFTLMNIFNVY